MRNLLRQGQQFLNRQQRIFASSMVVYRRDADGVTIRVPALRGKTDAAEADSNGAVIDATLDDWLILVEDLVAGGVRFKPALADTITDPDSGRAFQVAGKPCWRYSDTHATRYRIHVNEVAADV